MNRTPTTPSDSPASRHEQPEGGFALILVVIFSVLLGVLITELVVTARMARSTGRNDALMARMDNHLHNTYEEVLQQLRDDLEGGDAPPAPGGEEGEASPFGAPGEGSGEGEESEDPTDSRNDPWYDPTPYSDGELTTYVFIEDENRKFNILALVSPDQEFADESKERLIRLIVALRENTPFEIPNSDASTIADSVVDWLSGLDRDDENLPKPKLKSDVEGSENTIPLHLEELLLLRGVTESVFYDMVMDGPPATLLPGLESALTIYTTYRADPGDPKKNERRAAAAPEGNQNPAPAEPSGEEGTLPAAEGLGGKINVNTASRAVLRCLFSDVEISDAVIEAILRFRNEEAEEEEGAEGEGGEGSEDAADYLGDVEEAMSATKQIFGTLADLEEIPEFASIGDTTVKEKFLSMLTTQSDVFTVHMACMFKRNEERKQFVLTRRKSVVIRLEGDEQPRMYPIFRMERSRGVRILGVDFPEEDALERERQEGDMNDEFAVAERQWNPYFVEFYEKNANKR